MTTEELTDKMAGVFNNVFNRVEGIGDHQYANDLGKSQAFEEKTLAEIFTDTLEEVEDAISYLSFLHIRIQQLMKVMGHDNSI